jgi:hypothetical protein
MCIVPWKSALQHRARLAIKGRALALVRGFAKAIAKHLTTQFDYFCFDAAILHGEFPYAHRQLEPPGAAAARIEEEDSVPRFAFRDMAVAGDHNLKSRSLGLQIQMREIVQHVDGNAACFENFGRRQASRPRFFIYVATHRGEGSDGSELFQNLWRADIAGMNDSLRTL